MECANPLVIFLGILLDGLQRLLVVPEEKRVKAVNAITCLLMKKKATVKQIQCLTGLLNFLNHTIVPGRAFTRCMHAKIPTVTANAGLKHYHHVKIDNEFKDDCRVWLSFLENVRDRSICRPFIDLYAFENSQPLDFHTDASKGVSKGIGCVFGKFYTWGQWDPDFIKLYNPSIEYLELLYNPSIEYLELLSLTVGVLVWSSLLQNKRIIIYCDNQAVVQMVNNSSSSRHNCMVLIRKLVLDNLISNRRLLV